MTALALVETPPAEDVTRIQGRSALRDQTATPGFEGEDVPDSLMLRGLDMDVRDRHEDLVQDAGPMKGLENHRPALAVHVAYTEFVNETLV